MADNNQKVIDRVRKLLELAKSSNVNEAANAAAAAQELMTRHAIAAEVLTAQTPTLEPEEPIVTDVLFGSDNTRRSTWRGRLAVAICSANQCKAFNMGAQLGVIGRPSNASKARTLFAHVATEIERITAEALRERGNPGKTWANNFKIGATSEISERLRAAALKAREDMRKEAFNNDQSNGGTSLVLVTNALARIENHMAEIDKYGKERLGLKPAPKVRINFDEEARAAGRRAASNIDLSGRARLNQGVRGALK